MLAFVAVGAIILSGCASASPASNGPTAKSSDAAVVTETNGIENVDVCAWADQALAASESGPTIAIPEPGGSIKWHEVTSSTGQNESTDSPGKATVSCNLLYDNTSAISLVVALSSDPDRSFDAPEPGSAQPGVAGPVELSGFLGVAEPPAPLTLQLDDTTYLDITVYDDDARYGSGKDNLWGAVMPVARELAAIWASGDVPKVGEVGTAPVPTLDWVDSRAVCGTLDATMLGTILGLDSATQQLSIEATSGSDSGSNGLVSDTVYCTFEAKPNRDDPSYPHRVEVQLFHYATAEDGAEAFSAFSGYDADCPTDGTAIMYECDGGNTTTVTRSGKLMAYIQTFDGSPANVDPADLDAKVLNLGASILSSLEAFS
ncbi:hypothetical protein [uncultured Microbacterium sp.]|uniref:hypothetical protein n=1 Tax=uncultured Microbacterium sp. TaxID=191216 RepID=UPI0035CC50B5